MWYLVLICYSDYWWCWANCCVFWLFVVCKLLVHIFTHFSILKMFVGDFNSIDIALLLYFVGKYDLSVTFLISGSFDRIEVLSFYVFKCLFLYHFRLFSHLGRSSSFQDYNLFLLYSFLLWFFNILVLVPTLKDEQNCCSTLMCCKKT